MILFSPSQILLVSSFSYVICLFRKQIEEIRSVGAALFPSQFLVEKEESSMWGWSLYSNVLIYEGIGIWSFLKEILSESPVIGWITEGRSLYLVWWDGWCSELLWFAYSQCSLSLRSCIAVVLSQSWCYRTSRKPWHLWPSAGAENTNESEERQRGTWGMNEVNVKHLNNGSLLT